MPTTQPRSPRRPAQAVTDARASTVDDRSRRMRHYLLAMGVRTLCFPLAVWAFVQQYYVLAGVTAVLAAVIPSFAVMIANAADRRGTARVPEVRSPVQGLGPGRAEAEAPEAADAPQAEQGPQVIPGTIVSRTETAYPSDGEREPPTREAS